MDNQVSTRIQNALLNNRVKILKLCDYFTVSAPLISRRILPMDKHKEIRKTAVGMIDAKAANTARMDALLDFIDEVPSHLVFDAFLEGIRNCESSKQFAKILKKEVEGGNTVIKLPPKIKSPKPRTSFGKLRPSTTNAAPPFSTNIFGGVGNGPASIPVGFSFANSATFSAANIPQAVATDLSRGSYNSIPPATKVGAALKKKLPKKIKTKDENGPLIATVGSSTDVFTFNPNAIPAPPVVPKPRNSRLTKKKPALKSPMVGSATPENGNGTTGTGTPSGGKKDKKPIIKRVYPSKAKAKTLSKVVTPGPSLTATLVYKKPEVGTSNSVANKPIAEEAKGFIITVPVGSPFRPKNGMAKSQHVKQMTFQEAEEKQKNTIRATGFSFLNSSALVKKINFNNKSDLFYEGCPTKEGNYLCTRKVQLKGKGKKYVCKEKHENEAYELFPRLFVTFEDSTAQMEATVFRENVEILAGKSVTDMHVMNDTALSTEFAKAIGKNIPIRVTSEKILKKDLKSAGGKTWNNIAHIVSEVDPSTPPSKKSKKAPAE